MATYIENKELAWVAGVIDGDGSISVSPLQSRGYAPAVSVTSTHVETLERIQRAVCRGRIAVQRGRCYTWSAEWRDAIQVAKALLPYLYTKRPQAELLQTYEVLPVGGYRRSAEFMANLWRCRQQLSHQMSELNQGGTPEPQKSHAGDCEVWAWLAGLFDAEGCCSLHEHTNGRHFVLATFLGMQHLPTVEYVRSITGSGTVVHRPQPTGKTLYVWRTCSRQAECFLNQIEPYAVTKQGQIRAALQFRSTVSQTRQPVREDVIEERRRLVRHMQRLNQGEEAALWPHT